MYTIVYKPSKTKIITLSLLCLLYIVSICKFIGLYFQHGAIVAGLVVGLSVVGVVRAFGYFVMYPGTYRYLTAQIQKNQNDYLLNLIHQDMSSLQKISSHIISRRLSSLSTNYVQLYGPQLPNSITLQLNILQKSETKSQIKKQLIETYRELINCIETKISTQQMEWVSLEKIISNPTAISKILTEDQLARIQDIGGSCRTLCGKIWLLCTSIAKIQTHQDEDEIESSQSFASLHQSHNPPNIRVQKWQIADWLLHSQKLFTTNSYFAYWDNYFNYTTFMVPVQNGHMIECAIIHEQKNKINAHPFKNAVLFSNPNGAIFQAFALTSTYINFYLKWGLRVILWNYRGYANSTGFATVNNCISDVEKVYEYVTKSFNLNIKVVHGYSIGGVAAISLVNKLNSGPSRPVKLLIADRTFSSIDRVAKCFAENIQLRINILPKIATPIVKLFFHSECTDNSKKFIKCNCQKILIYDTNDQIISNEASLKLSVQQNALNSRQVENNESGFNFSQFRDQAFRFASSAANIQKIDKRVYEKVMRILYDMDGGGKFVHLKMGMELDNGKSFTYSQIFQQSKQYFSGLILFGPKLCLRYYANFQQEQRLVQQKMSKKIELLKQYEQKLPQDETTPLRKQVQSIIEAFSYAKSELTRQKIDQRRKIFGDLIVTEVGHNSQLKQWWQFQRLLSRSISENAIKQPQN